MAYSSQDTTARSRLMNRALGIDLNDVKLSYEGNEMCCDSTINFCRPSTTACSIGPWIATCGDAFASGKCLFGPKSQGQIYSLDYQVEVCDNSSNFIATALPSSALSVAVVPTSTTSDNPVNGVPVVDTGNNSNGMPTWATGLYVLGAIIGLGIFSTLGFLTWKHYHNKNREVARIEVVREEIEFDVQNITGRETRRRSRSIKEGTI